MVPEDAAIVQDIYQRYLHCRSVRELAHGLKRDGITSKRKARKEGHLLGDGALYVLLSNPIYIGQISHKGTRYAGLHDGIIEPDIWDAVQKKLLAGTVAPDSARRKTDFSPLMGKLFDESGKPLSPDHSCKAGRRYRYYVSRPEHQQDGKSLWRLPAKEFERCVMQVVMMMIGDRGLIASAALAKEMNAEDLDAVLVQASRQEDKNCLSWVHRVELNAEQIAVWITLPGTIPLELTRIVPMVLKKRGVERRIVIHGNAQLDASPDPLVMSAISRGARYWEQLQSGQQRSFKEIAKAEKLDDRYVGRTLQLAFLAPDIVEMFMRGRQPPDWSAERLLRGEPLPVSWEEQRKVFGLN